MDVLSNLMAYAVAFYEFTSDVMAAAYNLSRQLVAYARYKLRKAYERAKSRLEDFYNYVRDGLRSTYSRTEEFVRKKRNYYGIVLMQKKRRYRNRFKNAYRSEYGDYAVSFVAYIVLYGLLINYPLMVLAGMDMNLYTVPAYGLTWYFIKEEVVEMLQGIKPYVEVKVKKR